MTAPRAGDHDASTVLIQRRTEEAGQASTFRLTVVDGADRGTHLVIDGTSPPRLLVGQSPLCELRLTDPLVSRRHLALELAGDALRVFDLDSSNGVMVNGLRVSGAFLRGGETILLGGTTLALHQIAGPAPIALSGAMRFGRMIGASREMRRLYPLCHQLAATDIPVVLEGETGTGKEVLAEAIHDASARRLRPFVVFDCTAVAPSLLESALFGHEKGSFTGAISDRSGVFEEAHGGTFLLDEIGELDLSLQPKLLRVLERSLVQRVGGAKWRKVDVRVLAATRRDLDQELAAGRFRDDLFFRLAVARIELPPLRRRKGDVTVLARHFWHTLGGDPDPMPTRLLERFEAHTWPGNVRELHNSVARFLALGDVDLRDGADAAASDSAALSPTTAPAGDSVDRILALDLPLARARAQLVEDFERRYVERVLERHSGNVVRAAAASGIARRYFQILRARHK